MLKDQTLKKTRTLLFPDKRIVKTLRFEHASQNASGFCILLYSTVYEWIFGTRVLSAQPRTLSNTEE